MAAFYDSDYECEIEEIDIPSIIRPYDFEPRSTQQTETSENSDSDSSELESWSDAERLRVQLAALSDLAWYFIYNMPINQSKIC